MIWTSFTWLQVGLALLVGLILCHVNLYLTSSVLHRGLCHGAIIYPGWLKRTVAAWLWLTACVPPLTWIASHLHHHAHSDTEKDPHAPSIKGFWKVLLLTWYYVPAWSRSNWEYAQRRYLNTYRNDRLLHFLDASNVANTNFYLQVFISIALGPVFIMFWLARIVPYMLLSGYVNASGHTHGNRPHDNLGTDAKGILQKCLGYLVGGETLGHNYHHRYSSSATFRPSKFDPGLWFATKMLRGAPAIDR